MNANEEFNKAVDFIEQALASDNEEEAYVLWSEAIMSAFVAQRSNKDDAEYNYLTGYIFYKCPRKTEEIWRNAEKFLKAAVKLCDSHQLANYYLSCVLYDRGKYAEALIYLESISTDYFIKLGQPWRIIKANELRLCCNLYLNLNGECLNQATKFLENYKNCEDISLAPYPVEFANCLNSLIKRNGENEGKLYQYCGICSSIFSELRASDVFAERWPLVQSEFLKN